MIYKTARYRVKKEELEFVKKAISEFVDEVKKNEPDTLSYDAYMEDDDLSFLHFMSFKDREAEEYHRATPHVKEFVKKLYPTCDIEPYFTEIKLIRSNKRIEGEYYGAADNTC